MEFIIHIAVECTEENAFKLQDFITRQIDKNDEIDLYHTFVKPALVSSNNDNELNCPDDCKERKGRFCLLGTNHCVRRSDDYYQKG